MVDSETTNLTKTTSELSVLFQLNELRSAWEECQPKRAEGGLLSLSGFEHQFLLTLLKIVRQWNDASETERQSLNTAHAVLTEAISDITESGICVTITQVKRTLSESLIREALEELWEIFNLASERTPSLVQHLRFVISGKFEGDRNARDVIQGWGIRKQRDQLQKLQAFKTHVSYEYVSDPKTDLTVELENLSRDEDTQTTIGRWLGYLLQLGSGLSPERASSLIWRELRDDESLTAFRATLARLFSQSRYRFRAVRHTLGGSLSLPRTDLLSQLKVSIQAKQVSLILGASGSGKSALCTLGMQTSFQDNTCLFLHPSDIVSFTETPESISSPETRRLDELLAAQVIEKPVIIIDDLSDVDDHSFDCVLNLLQNALTRETSDVRFVLVAHLDDERRVRDKIAARLGAEVPIDVVKLRQLPIDELQSSNALPGEVAELINRADQFGPALNLKLLDYLISGVQQDDIKTSSFRNDLDLLNWFWRYQVGNGYEVSQESRVLIDTALLLADKFTSDLSVYDSPVDTNTLYTLVRRDCFRVVDDRVAVTHRFVGDCARFRYLLARRRELEVSELAQRLRNPLWCQPMRWFALHLAMESAEAETWQELLQESSEGNHLQLTDLLLDGAILSKQGSNVLQGCSEKRLPFIVERIICRLLAIATFPHPVIAKNLESMSLGKRLVTQEQITGIPKAHLWEPIWRWLLSQNPEVLIEKSDSIFKAAEAWINWGQFTARFPLQVEVAEFVLDLDQRVLLPEPDKQRQYWLRNSSDAFACIVDALIFVPERSAWLLRVLAGREVIPSKKSKQTSIHPIFRTTGTLESPHPRSPSGQTNSAFQKFMLKHGGLYLSKVVRVNPKLGAELLLALTIAPRNKYKSRLSYLRNELGTTGSSDIDVCTFKFLPILALLQINEYLAIDVIATLCNVATNYWHEHRWKKNKLEGMPKTDTDSVTLLIDNNRKQFKGGRHALYWHRKYAWCPDIVACFLMTLEGWLYSRPTKAELERSISIIFERADTVAMLGVLISLAKYDPTLLQESLLPLLSSLQLLVWFDFEKKDQSNIDGFDDYRAYGTLLKKDYQELLEFYQLPHRKTKFLELAIETWLKGSINQNTTSQTLADWDNHQLALVPDVNRYRALQIRACFDRNNWIQEENDNGTPKFRFIGILPKNPEIDALAESDKFKSQYLEEIIKAGERIPKLPKLLREISCEMTRREAILRGLIEVRVFFMEFWIKEYGIADPLTQELINVTPLIARLIALNRVLSPADDTEQSIKDQENYKIEKAWINLQHNFVHKKVPKLSIIDAFRWTPEILVQPLQQQPDWLHDTFDWNFLKITLVPVLKAQSDSQIAQDLAISLCEQLLFAILHEREFIYARYQAAQEEYRYPSLNLQLSQTQRQLLDAIVNSSPQEITKRINLILCVMNTKGVVDCIVLGHVVHNLRHSSDMNVLSLQTNSIPINDIVFAIGNYLFGFHKKTNPDLLFVGKIRDIWKELIQMISQEELIVYILQEKQENNVTIFSTDEKFVQFFNEFLDVLLFDWLFQLYRVGKLARYRQFRRELFKRLIQHPELFPTYKNEASKLLVQVLAELWDSDSTWVTNRLSLREGLKTLLGQLQEIDAVGARSLADQIADSLSNTN